MFSKILQIFNGPAPSASGNEQPDPAERIQLATCVIMLEVAKSDEEFSDDERAHIVETLKTRFSLSTGDATELMDHAAAHRDGSVDLWQYTNAINETCTDAEKIDIIEEVWRVVVADGGIHGHESHFMRSLARLLNLPHGDLIDAKAKVLREAREA